MVVDRPNRLIHETSPYLRQHAHNPVDWYPWGTEALERAQQENKPILLSVGYSACHWCHVMERESFENPDTARLMNEHFVSIKVDREERPDIDHIYMGAVQLLTGHGGWPMTVFLTPDGRPFYGGTYFPPEDRHGMPGFPRLLVGIAGAYRNQPENVDKTVENLMAHLGQQQSQDGSGSLPGTEAPLEAAAQLSRAYDERDGGIGQAPKFPNTCVFNLFLRVFARTGNDAYRDRTMHTLRRMAAGGIYDQLGGGFHRYSVDQHWLVPHFEKMLYDNAQLVPLYLSAHLLSGDPTFARIARETLDYVAREMRDDAGGFYSTQDADSEGEEGRFFLWDPQDFHTLLGEETGALACRYWDVSEGGNFEGRNILHLTLDVAQLANAFGRDPDEVGRTLELARSTLFHQRESRIRPDRDEKILTAWNGLMISAYARAAEALDDDGYRAIAESGVSFIQTALQRDDRLLSTYKDGVAKLNGYLDDYAFFAAALLDVYEATQNLSYLENARNIVDSMLLHFWDERAGGFFFTSDDHEALIVRSKPAFDGSIPSGNSVAAHCLLRIHHWTGKDVYRSHAEEIFRLFAPGMATQPFGFANLLAAFDFYTEGPREIVLLAKATDPEAASLLRRIRRTYLPTRVLTLLDPDDSAAWPGFLQGKTQVGKRPTAYVCHRRTCSPPATTWAELEPLLDPARL